MNWTSERETESDVSNQERPRYSSIQCCQAGNQRVYIKQIGHGKLVRIARTCSLVKVGALGQQSELGDP